jgi:outer membrane murein-binding lipoprotein Lpp
MILLLAASTVGMSMLTGCVNNLSLAKAHGQTQSPITVTATSGSLQHTTGFSLKVN